MVAEVEDRRGDGVVTRVGPRQRQAVDDHRLADPRAGLVKAPTASVVTRLTASVPITPSSVAPWASIVAAVVPLYVLGWAMMFETMSGSGVIRPTVPETVVLARV